MSESLEKIDRRVYSTELKQEAVRLVMEQGLNCTQAGGKLGVPAKTLANWARPHRRKESLKQIAQGVANDDPAALKADNLELRKQNLRLRQERDILKKFSQYAAGQMPGGLP